ncbi:cell wall-binding repeat-containing protein [Euzebya rosea]|uniref:cell wall-binding repeat-containing protein n=1 Tax=Euzebya rosea TaxID=2052804 RepID=UPI000D3EA90D|nr:cell wall-binding repeat-containing protein [Euzebya rosea]
MGIAGISQRTVLWAVLGVAALAGVAAVLGARTAPAATGPPAGPASFAVAPEPVRLGGTERHETAAIVATAAFPDGASVAVLARSDVYTDALTGSVLAGALDAPMLLTPGTQLADATRDALETLGTTRVLVLGGTSAIGEVVVNGLRDAGLEVSRVAGADRYGTAAAVARAADEAASVGLLDGDRLAFVASGLGFADVLSVGGLAYSGPHPIVLAGVDGLPPSSLDLMEDIAIDRVVIVGGEAVVPTAVERQLDALGIPHQRAAGASRGETATAVADLALTDFGFSWDRVALVRGDEPVDALSGSPWTGRMHAPTLLVLGPFELGLSTENWLADRCSLGVGLVAFGGTSAITPATLARAVQLADCTVEPTTPPPGETEPPGPGTSQLLTATQQTFEGGIDGWAPRGNVVVGPGTTGRLDTSSLRLEVSEDGVFPDDTGTARAGTTPGRNALRAVPGRVHTGSLWIRPVGRTSPVRCEIRWYDADGTILHTAGGPTVMERVGEWVQTTCSAFPPPDAVGVALRVFVDEATWGDVHHIDDASLLVVDDGDPSPSPTPSTQPATPPTPPPPAPPPPPPVSGGWPDGPDDTGIAAVGLDEDDLTDTTTLRLTSGDVVENMHVRGTIIIEEGSANVVIRNSLIETDGRYGIQSASGVTNLLVENVTIRGTGGSRSAAILARGQGTIRGVNASAFRDGIKVFSDMVVEDSWIHDLVLIGEAHRDGIQAVGGRNVTIRNNRIEGPYQTSTSAMHIAADLSPITNYTITGNFLSGGTFTVYLTHKDDQSAPTDIVLSDNVFDGVSNVPSKREPANSWQFGTCSLRRGARWTVEGNTFVDGSPDPC